MNFRAGNKAAPAAAWLLGGAILMVSAHALGATEGGDARAGAETWAENCTRCHNAREPRDLRDDQWMLSVYHMRVRAGLTGQQTRDVLAYLQGANDVPVGAGELRAAGAGAVRSGMAIYTQDCVACHAKDGRGAVPGAPDFTAAAGPLAQADDVLMRHIRQGFKSPDSPMAMPPRGGDPALSEAEVEAVLAYLRKTFGR